MRRREFIGLVGGAAATWPLRGYAQQPERLRRIGVLMPYTRENPEDQRRTAALLDGLKKLGWSDGRNIQCEFRWYAGDAAQAQSAAKELVALDPALILVGAAPGLVALNHETKNIPIVFVGVTDPVGLGLVQSLARPGGNATGFSFFEFSVATKLVESLVQIAPNVKRIAIMYSPNSPVYQRYLDAIDAAAPSIARALIKVPVRNIEEIEAAIKSTASEADGGLVVLPEPLFPVHSKEIVELAARYNVPTIYSFRLFADDGGLMSYSVDVVDLYRRAAGYVDRILRGGVAADMPVQQPIKYELAINLKTARSQGIDVSSTLIARADAVIE
jgi:putative ABC transport system substrate-binding protein